MVNRLSLNIDKTNFIVFHPYNKPMKHLVTLKFHKKAILEKSSIKYLGVMIDSNLTRHSHIEKMSRAIGLLYKIRPFVNIKIMKTLCYALVYPHILYAIEVWGSAGITIINRLLMLQKRIVRLLSYSNTRNSDYSFPPSNPLVFKKQMLKVEDLFKTRIAKFIHNCLNKTSHLNFHLWFKLTILIHNHNTRSKYISIDNLITTNNLFIPTARTYHFGLKLIKVLGPNIWNEIPPLIRNISSPKMFINKLKKAIVESMNL